jgi:chemotaxis protein methyltransferase CheR
MGLRSPGFRRVRGQVRKRLARRLSELRVADVAGYRALLERDASEWEVLDRVCRITISRFYRDRHVFDRLRDDTLPGLARAALERGAPRLACWSAGCACGEEPHTLAILWHAALEPRFPGLALSILATDVDGELLERARRGAYGRSSLSALPAVLADVAFDPEAGPKGPLAAFGRLPERGDPTDPGRTGRVRVLRERFREGVTFARMDVRHEMPAGPFDLILCRNLVFTYFDEPTQLRLLDAMVARLAPGGALAIGRREQLPSGRVDLVPDAVVPEIRWRASAGGTVTADRAVPAADPGSPRLA